MSYNDPTHWRCRAEDIRALAERMKDGISKHMMGRIAEDYERLARTAEQRANVFPRSPEVVPANLRLFAYRRNPASAQLAEFSNLDIPSFLKRGPATAEEVGAPAVSTAHPGTMLTTMRESEKGTAELQDGSSGLGEVEACISAIEKAMGLPPLGSHTPHEATREVGCNSIAQALKNNPH